MPTPSQPSLSFVEAGASGAIADLAIFRKQIPQLEGEKNQVYARRLHLTRPQLTLKQISQLSGVRESTLRADPAFQELPADLAPIREQVPQLEGEKNQAYARRLRLARPQLTLSQISQLSGVMENNLKRDPAFQELPADLPPIREQVPQLEGEKNQAYARRLHLARPQLTLPQISQLSGVVVRNLKRDPAFQEMPADLALIREQVPQLESEKNAVYARRLRVARPHLTLTQISQLSGVMESNLKREPVFQDLSADLAPIREQVPQLEGESNPAYARRLHVTRPQLTVQEICRLSGVPEGNLKLDPTFQELPADLAPIREQVPQLEGESNPAYARRLHVALPQLTLPQLSQLSGVVLTNLRRDPAFQGLPADLAPIREQVPRLEGESNPAYARRLHLARPQLTLSQLSQLSGVVEFQLKGDPTFQELPADLVPIRDQVPQLEGESNLAYARRLHLARPQLTLPQISLLSGVMEVHLKQDPAFRELPADLVPIREQVPQLEGEKNQTYARRLHLARPQLTLPQISQLSGVTESNLKRDPAFHELPADLAPIREQVPQLERENKQAYARRLRLEHPQLTLPQISLLSGVMESHLKHALAIGPRRPLSTSVEAANRARSESSARRSRGLKRTASEAAAAQPASHEAPIRSERSRLTEPGGSLRPMFDERARLYPHDRQAALEQAARGATAAATPDLTNELEARRAQAPERASHQPYHQPAQPEFAGMTPAWEGLADVARPSELADNLMPANLPGAAIAEDSEIFAMIDGWQQLPSELHFMAQPPDSQSQTIGAVPAATVEMPPRVTPAAALLQIQPQHIEAAVTALRQGRFGLNREEIEQAAGLPAGVLAAVVDTQGNWLNQAALSVAVADLSAAQVQTFAMTLEQMRANVPQLETTASHEAPVRSVRSRLTEPSGTLSPVFDGQAGLYPHDMQPALEQAARDASAVAAPEWNLFPKEPEAQRAQTPERASRQPFPKPYQAEFVPTPRAWDEVADAPRPSELAARSMPTNLPGPASAEDSEIAAMIDELQQPGELYFMAQPPDSRMPDDDDRR